MRFGLFILFAAACHAATISVTDFGAVGDAVDFTCSTTSGSAQIVVTSTNVFSGSDVGKLVQLFGAGASTSGTNHQDYIGTLLSVSAGTNLTISSATGADLGGVQGTIGTENRVAIQSAINSLSGTNDVITIPSGRFLVVSAFQLTNTAMSSVFEVHGALSLSRGGITFQGAPGATLLNCGAWLLKGSYVHRGSLLDMAGPVTNNYPVVFDTLVFDGGVNPGMSSQLHWPASTNTGFGWDVTHDATLDRGSAPMHLSREFRNCTFQHWRGEILKSGVATSSGTITITNCTFYDGNASAFNYALAHHISNSRFERLQLGMEFYSGHALLPSVFENNVITSSVNGLVIVGALTNHVEPSYTVSGNSISSSSYVMLMAPARNLLITNNLFFNAGISTSGAGNQGTDKNADWLVINNVFTNNTVGYVFANASYTTDATENIVFSGNKTYGAVQFATGFGRNESSRFSLNQMLSGSIVNALDSRMITGVWFYDDGSNEFPPFANLDFTGVTNTISYNLGARQNTVVTTTNSVWLLGDSTPSMIPPGAVLILTHTGNKPTQYRTSSTTNGKRLLVQVGETRTFNWRGGKWKDSRMGYIGTARIGRINGS